MLFSQIYPVTCSTKHIGEGSTFVAIKGFKIDGFTYIQEAIQRGATTIVIDQEHTPPQLATGIQCLVVPDTRKALAELASTALGNPAQKLKIIGITGTAGKTTTTYLIHHIFTQAGFKTAILGGINNKILDQEESSSLTTPESDYIQMFLAECVRQGVTHVVMEVSSHSIALHRIHTIPFFAVGFTNLSQEHMDFHQTMKHYFETKMQLFKHVPANGIVVINTDTSWGQQAHTQFKNDQRATILSFGTKTHTNPQSIFKTTQNNFKGVSLNLSPQQQSSPIDVTCPNLFGDFNSYNIVMATLICMHAGINSEKIISALKTFKGVPGRLQLHTLKNNAKAFIDFAHKPGPFEEVLRNLRPLTSHLIVVFGCGGDRDKTKRPVMGALAAQYADFIIITDDNPRTENRQTIAHEIFSGIPHDKKEEVTIELDRKKAIALAAQKATPSSVIALLGKGHENYYLIQGQKLHLDDLEEISRY